MLGWAIGADGRWDRSARRCQMAIITGAPMLLLRARNAPVDDLTAEKVGALAKLFEGVAGPLEEARRSPLIGHSDRDIVQFA
eukprot:1281454-Pyramimonas_sp.AAC.1